MPARDKFGDKLTDGIDDMARRLIRANQEWQDAWWDACLRPVRFVQTKARQRFTTSRRASHNERRVPSKHR